ncbi:bifunctional glycosyltransferase/CDP-glycerol:glycerophosphate glycerophosphotransferase [Paenochrobactrum pullorum]|uniref:bifunctional glycosyltransferase/CDP-glycerol:glycerophosphate glycerophosphotransferase n=1 Tax=Paenochrobactrum pullorum TaxID=1324351 RepID=UPI0035BC4E65
MKLSIIIVTWNNENYIEQALNSCINPDFSDYEIIVVHNASTDRTGELIRRTIRGNENLFKIIENEANVGLGEGRNIGMRHAKGEYFMFLDGDDWYSEQMLNTVFPIISSSKPELVIIDFLRYHQDARLEANPQRKQLNDGWRNRTQERAQLLKNFGVAWNKVYKKSFIDHNKLTFPQLYYEDIVWNMQCILLASSVYVTQAQLVFYRQRPGSILRSTDMKHFDSITQHNGIISFLEDNPNLIEDYGIPLRNYSRHQMFATIHLGGRVPVGKEGKFLKLAYKTLKRYDKLLANNGVYAHAPNHKIREKVASLGIYPLYKALRLTERLKKKYFTPYAERIHKYCSPKKHRFLEVLYTNVLVKFPVKKNRVLFDSFWGHKTDGNPLTLYKALQQYKQFDCAFMLRRDGVSSVKNLNRVGRSSLKGYWYMATSQYLVTNSAFPDNFIKKSNMIMLQTQHGTPFKYMGLDQRKIQPKAMNWWRLTLNTRIWDFILSSNDHSSSVWRQAYPYNYKVLEVGYPSNDQFYHAKDNELSNLRKKFKIPDGKKIALYAPTFRTSRRNKEFYVDEIFNPVKVVEALGDNFVLLLRGHYFTKSGTINNQNVIDVSTYPVTNDILTIADILITDYSSISVDYANTKKPIILYTYDYEEYKAERGLYVDIRELLPSTTANNFDELITILKEEKYNDHSSKIENQNFRSLFCKYEDGKSTQKVLKEVFSI